MAQNKKVYGDFQTNDALAKRACEHLKASGADPQIVIEPTCGKGSFIEAALRTFGRIEYVLGVEVYAPYISEARERLQSLRNELPNLPAVSIEHSSFFDFSLKQIRAKCDGKELLIIGNPPWVTNSDLGKVDAGNLPPKRNVNVHSGLDAMTGKSNFDISEAIINILLAEFRSQEGHLALLIKDSVARKVVRQQMQHRFEIGDLRHLPINTKKEFDAAVSAGLFTLALNRKAEYTCEVVSDWQAESSATYKFGWAAGNRFVSNIDTYIQYAKYDNVSDYVWRQGLKHDCSKVMELTLGAEDRYVNGLQEEFEAENDLIYGLIKSSDLNKRIVDSCRKLVIVTQKKIGQSTAHIKDYYPKLYTYLDNHREAFSKRKSSIYRGKPPFSIFGIGDYAFKPYKVAISGLYKRTTFSLVMPYGGKPVMLDDTCFYLGFDNREQAEFILDVLNGEIVQKLLNSLIFYDAKRLITKDVLMRLDLSTIICDTTYSGALKDDRQTWQRLKERFVQNETRNQLSLFG